LVLVAGIAACGNSDGEIFEVDPGVQKDFEGPVIEHIIIPAGQPYGQPVTVSATITDALHDVRAATLYYTQEGSIDYAAANMTQSDADPDVWEATIPGDEVYSAGMIYYIWAQDTYEDRDQVNETYLPDVPGGEQPYRFSVVSN
jgi:hypothetical protein